ncbi:MAG: hypothetical protein V4858_17065 [Pseudomonadota bacterium]
MSYESREVAAVCDNEVRIYSGVQENGRRPLLTTKRFAHHGAAVNYAQEHDEAEKQRDERRR